MGKTVYEVDGRDFSTLEEFFEVIVDVLAANTPCGRGLDSFNGLLRGGFGTPDEGFILRWHPSDVSRERLGYAETVRQLQRRLERCHPSNDAKVGEQLRRAQAGDGPMAFDWLVDILATHGPGGEESEDGGRTGTNGMSAPSRVRHSLTYIYRGVKSHPSVSETHSSAIRSAAASRSSSETISTGECM